MSDDAGPHRPVAGVTEEKNAAAASAVERLYQYLEPHRVYGAAPCTHTRADAPPGQRCGKFFVPESDRPKFWREYLRCVRECGNPSLTEVQGDAGPVLLDWDFRLPPDDGRLVRDDAALEAVIRTGIDAAYGCLGDYLDLGGFVQEPRKMNVSTALISLRPCPYKGKDCVKEGVHITFPLLHAGQELKLAVRQALIDDAAFNSALRDLGVTNAVEDVVDRAVIRNSDTKGTSNNWYLYGAGKLGKAVYMVHYTAVLREDGPRLTKGSVLDFEDQVRLQSVAHDTPDVVWRGGSPPAELLQQFAPKVPERRQPPPRVPSDLSSGAGSSESSGAVSAPTPPPGDYTPTPEELELYVGHLPIRWYDKHRNECFMQLRGFLRTMDAVVPSGAALRVLHAFAARQGRMDPARVEKEWRRPVNGTFGWGWLRALLYRVNRDVWRTMPYRQSEVAASGSDSDGESDAASAYEAEAAAPPAAEEEAVDDDPTTAAVLGFASDEPPLKFQGMRSYAELKEEFERTHFKLVSKGKIVRVDRNGMVFLSGQELELTYKNLYSYSAPHHDAETDTVRRTRHAFLGPWLKDVNMRTIDRLDFLPPPKQCPPRVFNLYRGMRAARLPPAPEDYDLEPFLKLVGQLTGGDEALKEYTLNFFADIVQRPGRLPGTGMVFFSETEGVGKSQLMDFMGYRVVGGEMYWSSADPETFWGKFAPGLAYKLLINPDETSGGAMAKYIEKMKNSMTSATVDYEVKGRMKTVLQNFLRCAFSTNNLLSVKAGAADRRLVASACDNTHANDRAYFTPLVQYLQNDQTAAAVFRFLQQRDLSNWTVAGNRVETQLWRDLCSLSVPPMSRWLVDMLQNHALPEDWETTSELKNRFDAWLREEYNVVPADLQGQSRKMFGVRLNQYGGVLRRQPRYEVKFEPEALRADLVLKKAMRPDGAAVQFLSDDES